MIPDAGTRRPRGRPPLTRLAIAAAIAALLGAAASPAGGVTAAATGDGGAPIVVEVGARPVVPALGGRSVVPPLGAAPIPVGLAPRSVGSAPDPDWAWPVDGPRVVERPFLAPPTPYAAGHRGVDLAARSPGPDGLVVRSPVAGVVHFAGRVVDRGAVTVRAGPLLVTVEPVTAAVAEGDVVDAGQPLGALEPGHCATSCVHLGVREAGLYVSPMRWLGGLQRAVLLPLGAIGG